MVKSIVRIVVVMFGLGSAAAAAPAASASDPITNGKDIWIWGR
jgi:hypothetical protein